MVFETMWHVIVWYSNLEVIDSPSVSSLSFHSGSQWVFIPCWVNVPAQNQSSCFRTHRNHIQTYVAMWNLTRKAVPGKAHLWHGGGHWTLLNVRRCAHRAWVPTRKRESFSSDTWEKQNKSIHLPHCSSPWGKGIVPRREMVDTAGKNFSKKRSCDLSVEASIWLFKKAAADIYTFPYLKKLVTWGKWLVLLRSWSSDMVPVKGFNIYLRVCGCCSNIKEESQTKKCTKLIKIRKVRS